MEKTLTIHIKPDINTLGRAALHVVMRQTWIKVIVGLWIFISVFQLVMPTVFNNDPIEFYQPLLLPLLLIAFYFLIRNSIRKALRQNPKCIESQTYTIGDKGISIAGETYNSSYEWQHVKKIVETKEWFLLYLQKTQAIILDKKQLPAVEIAELKQLFSTLPIQQKLKP